MTDPSAEQDPRGTRLSVRHRTAFSYSTSALNNANMVHLEPRDFQYQHKISSIIRVIPATRVLRFIDLYGNPTHYFELTSPHHRLEIESFVKVRNLPLNISADAYSGSMEIYSQPEVKEHCWPFLQDSRRVTNSPLIWRQSLDLTHSVEPVFEKTKSIMQWIQSEFAYEPGSTGVDTALEQSFAERRGVCQDFSHIMIGMCRSIGIPARYASGYIYTGDSGDSEDLVGSQASHAWCEIYLPNDGWTGFDPTNTVLADNRYIKTAIGRDYEDVAPIRGSYRGPANCRMEVEVSVTLG